jgi:hypothetical protein
MSAMRRIDFFYGRFSGGEEIPVLKRWWSLRGLEVRVKEGHDGTLTGGTG